MNRRIFVRLAFLVSALSGCQAPSNDAEQAILAQEKRALDRWSQGTPVGFADVAADDITYFDDIGAHARVAGIAGMKAYLASLDGKIPPHRYTLVDPKVQVYGDVGILTLGYHASSMDGKPLTRWKATSIYRRTGGEWRMVHAHWSTVKQPN